MKKKYAVVNVKNKNLKHGGDVSLNEAQGAYIEGFMQSASKKKKTKYKGISGFNFKFL